MTAKPFGPTGVEVPIIGQGTWRMGEAAARYAAERAALTLGLDLGLTHIDTAEMYGRGAAEEIVAEVIRDRRRDALFITSKVLPDHASYRGTLRACEQSLQRLKTDYLDLYLLHWPGSHPIADTMGAMEELVATGKIRTLGVSNFDVDELRAALAVLTSQPMACNQVMYNLAARGIEHDLLPLCERHDIAVVGYTPFGSFPTRGPGLEILREIGRRHGKTPRQVALRFLTRTPALFAIPKAVEPDHVRENAGAGDFDLTTTDIATIDRAFPAPRRKVPLGMA